MDSGNLGTLTGSIVGFSYHDERLVCSYIRTTRTIQLGPIQILKYQDDSGFPQEVDATI